MNGTTTASYFATIHLNATMVLCDVIGKLLPHFNIMKQKKIANFNSNQKLKILGPRYPLLSEKELYLTHVDNLTDSLSNFSQLKNQQ